MAVVEVFEPALCCATGVCGADVDQDLVTFSADMEWVRTHGGAVRRYNLASEPTAFAHSEAASRFLQVAGSDGLPLVLVDGVTVLTGSYPSREKLASWTGVAVGAPEAAPLTQLSLTPAAGSGGGCCSGASTSIR